MVVSFDDQEKNAKLSLRQTEILAKLNEIVDDICADCPEKYVKISLFKFARSTFLLVYRFLNSTQNMAATCWSQPLDLLIPDPSPTYYRLKVICVTGKRTSTPKLRRLSSPLTHQTNPRSQTSKNQRNSSYFYFIPSTGCSRPIHRTLF